MSTMYRFLEKKGAEWGVDHSLLSSAEYKERVKSYHYTHSRHSFRVLG